jgi:undecaprenyl-diphosphatase
MVWEYSFLSFLQAHQTAGMSSLMGFLSFLGYADLLWILLGVLLLLPQRSRKTGAQVLAALLVTFVLGNIFLKPLFDRPDSFSFPSGHTMAALIGFSRMYNLVHYPTDVFAGMVIGIGIGLLVHFLFTRRRKPVNEPKKSRA